MISGKHAMIIAVVALMVAVLGVIGIVTAAGDGLEDDHVWLGSANDIAVQEEIEDCDTTTSHKLQYDQTLNVFSCDSTAPGSSITTQEDNAVNQTVSQIDWTNGLDRTHAAGEDVINVVITKATNPVALTDDNTWIGSATGDAAEEAVPDCDDTGGNHLNYDTTTNALSCGTSSSGGGGGDSITVNTASVIDTTANFLDGDIDFTHVDGGPGGPDDITATVGCTDCVALATETTGNFVATVADAGSATITVVGSGTENAAVTLDAVDLNCTDCLNATEIADIYVLNAGDTMTGNLVLDDGTTDSPRIDFNTGLTAEDWFIFNNDTTDQLVIQSNETTFTEVRVSNEGTGQSGLLAHNLTLEVDNATDPVLTVQGASSNLAVTASADGVHFDATIFEAFIFENSVGNPTEVILSGVGGTDSATLVFDPNTGTEWEFFVEDIGDDLQIEVNTAVTETLDIVNAGAGTIAVTIDSLATGGANECLEADTNGLFTLTGSTCSGVTLVSDPGGTTATTASESGLELVTGELSIIRGCTNGQITKWVSATESWDCSADSTGGTPSFDTIATGTNTTATMTVGSGATIALASGGLNMATSTLNTVNNDSVGTLFECTAVFISGFDIPSDLPEILIADADNASAMPAIGLLFADVTTGSDGFVTVSGQVDDLDTVTVEGWTVGDALYVNDSGTSADTDCGNTLTNVRPGNADDEVQGIAIVERVHATQGRLKIIGAGRSNDVPNLTDDNTWIGSSGNIATQEAVPDCDDTAGNHLNYDTTTNALSCGTSVRAIDISADTNLAVSGTLLNLTGDTLSVNEGTLTDEALCMFEGTGTQIECTVSTKATLEAQLSDVADIAEADGDVFTGVHDFGGATSLEIPNGAGGTVVNAAGEITVDTTSDTVNFFDGTVEAVLNPIKCGTITAEDPTSAEDISATFMPFAATVTEMRAVLIGSATPSVTWTVKHGTDRSAAGAAVVTAGTTTTSVTTGDDVTVFNDATIVADSFVWLETTAQSGTVTEITITICSRQDA